MEKKKKKGGLSRRSFLGNVGKGVAASYVMIPALKGSPLGDLTKKIEDQPHEGKAAVTLKVNGKRHIVLAAQNATLVDVLREELQLTGTKIFCGEGECGACTVLMDGKAVYSCHILAVDAEGKEITTIEGLLDGEKLHPIQEAFIEHDGYQCGYCTPGQIMAAQALLLKKPNPTKKDIRYEMAGNLCRCSAYPNIMKSVEAAASK